MKRYISKKNTFSIIALSAIFGVFNYLNAQGFNVTTAGRGTGGWIVCNNPPNCDFGDFMATVQNIMEALIALAIAFTVVTFAYAGWTYMTSAGDQSKIQKAHSMFTKTVIGFLVVLTAFLIVEMIVNLLGVDSSIVNLVR
jgi:hypothetical protein